MKKILLILFILNFITMMFSVDDITKDYTDKDWIKSGDKNYVNNKIFKAIECYTKAIELNPISAEAYFKRGKANKYFKYHQEAINDFVKAADLDSKYINILSEVGNDSYQEKDYLTALLYYNKAIELQQDKYDLYYSRAIIFQSRNQSEKALEDLNIAIKLNSKYAEAYNYRGYIYYIKKDYEKAAVEYNKAIEINPNIYYFYYYLGLIYDKKKSYDKSIIEYNKAIKLKSNYFYAYVSRGTAYLNLDENEKALNDFKKAIELDKKSYESLTYYGLSLIYTGDQKEALNVLDKAIKLNPKSDEAFIYKGLSYYFAKNFNNALMNFEEAIKVNSKFTFTYFLHLVASYKISESKFNSSKDLLNQKKSGLEFGVLLYSTAEFMDNKKTSVDLIKETGNDNVKLCTAYFAIGYKYLFENNKAKAKEFFQKCIDTKAFEIIAYRLAEIELSWL